MESKKLAELKKIAAFCRKNGVQSLKYEGIELVFNPLALMPTTSKRSKAEAEVVTEPTYTDEQVALWSSGGFDAPEALNG